MKAILPLAIVFALLGAGMLSAKLFGGPAVLWDAPLAALVFWIPCALFILAFPAKMLWVKFSAWVKKF